MALDKDILTIAADLKAEGQAFAMATVVRTVATTAAKAGAKALIAPDGSISVGWIGGGCARGAVIRAAQAALGDGTSRLISVQPKDLLAQRGLMAGASVDGVLFANNMCPSQGTMDIFIEPFLPRPHLLICGASPVAVALADLAGRMGFRVDVDAAARDHGRFRSADRMFEAHAEPPDFRCDFVVVATQGTGDLEALKTALAIPSGYRAFVGSAKKADALKTRLRHDADPARLTELRAPAGLALGAITPDEIALSIIAEIIEFRRRGRRQSGLPDGMTSSSALPCA